MSIITATVNFVTNFIIFSSIFIFMSRESPVMTAHSMQLINAKMT